MPASVNNGIPAVTIAAEPKPADQYPEDGERLEHPEGAMAGNEINNGAAEQEKIESRGR